MTEYFHRFTSTNPIPIAITYSSKNTEGVNSGHNVMPDLLLFSLHFPCCTNINSLRFFPQNWHSNLRRAQSVAMSYTFSLCPRRYILYLRQLLSNQTVTAMVNEMYYNVNIHYVGGYSCERVHNSVVSWRFGLKMWQVVHRIILEIPNSKMKSPIMAIQ